jgi:hypothetical protein
MRPSSVAHTALIAIAGGLIAIGAAHAQDKPDDKPIDKPTILGSPAIQVNPSTGAGRSGLTFQNESKEPLEVTLSAGALKQTGGSKISDAAITFAAEKDAGPGDLSYKFTIPPQSTVKVQAIIENELEPGQFEADLNTQAVKIGTIKVALLPVNVGLDSATPDKLDLCGELAAQALLVSLLGGKERKEAQSATSKKRRKKNPIPPIPTDELLPPL